MYTGLGIRKPGFLELAEQPADEKNEGQRGRPKATQPPAELSLEAHAGCLHCWNHLAAVSALSPLHLLPGAGHAICTFDLDLRLHTSLSWPTMLFCVSCISPKEILTTLRLGPPAPLLTLPRIKLSKVGYSINTGYTRMSFRLDAMSHKYPRLTENLRLQEGTYMLAKGH